MQKYTPGPWAVSKNSSGRRVTTTKGIVICNAVLRNTGTAKSRLRYGAKEVSEAEANARLIAAAPELLEALEGAIGALEQDYDAGKDMGDADWEGLAYQRLEAARAAIAKATQP